MTNLQAAANRSLLIWRQRALLGAPVLVGVVLAGAITAFLTLPRWTRLQAASATVDKLEALQRRIPILRAQLLALSTGQEQAERRQRRVLQLIEGSGDFTTFLAQLDREAGRNGLKLELFEPVSAAVVSAPPAVDAGRKSTDRKGAAQPPPPPPQDPLEAAGLAAERVLLSARGSYPSLLGFLRSVEQLSLLVVPSDFSLQLVTLSPLPTTGTSSASSPAVPATVPEMKLVFTYYRIPSAGLTARPPDPAAGTPPGG
ncbi:MAG: hypothetical protein VKI63_00350 [Cyanobium sp.]|nr:hypothetical protein [Cyanobium sp.]